MTKETKTEERERSAELKAAGIRDDYAYMDKRALGEAREAPSMESYLDELQQKTAEVRNTLEQLRSSIMGGDMTSGDIEKKVAFQKLLDNAENRVLHRFSQPENPANVESAQTALETMRSKWEGGSGVEKMDIFKKAIGGEEPSIEERGKLPSRDLGRLKDVQEVRTVFSPEKVSQLQQELVDAVERLKAALPEITRVAAEKAFPADQKKEKLAKYQEMYNGFQELRQNLLNVLEDVKKKTR